MERKTPLSIRVVGVAQWPQLAPNDFLGHREGIAAQQIDVFMNEGRQPCHIFIQYKVAFGCV